MAYENGEMSQDEALEFFAELIKDGTVWHLQGHYGRTANEYIKAVFIAEPFEVNEDTRITQKIFTDYDELDALAKAFGYNSPTPEQNTNDSLSGWIATMGDSMHNPIRMLRDAMQKLRNVKYEEICDKSGKIIKTKSTHIDAVMGFCQTGNFSIGYTIYIKLVDREDLEETVQKLKNSSPLFWNHKDAKLSDSERETIKEISKELKAVKSKPYRTM
jgi:hypothetical protein